MPVLHSGTNDLVKKNEHKKFPMETADSILEVGRRFKCAGINTRINNINST